MPAQSVPFYNPLDPAAALQATEIQRRQKLAETLMQGGQQQEGTQMAGNIAVPVSPVSALAKALQQTAGGYFEGQANRDALKLQQQQYASLLAAVTGQAPGSTDAANAQAGSVPGTSSATGAVPGAGLNPQVARMVLALKGPEGLGSLYGEKYLAETNPTDMMKNDSWQGINPNQQRALTMSEAAKNIGVSGGQPQFDPQGNMSVTPIPGAADTQAGFTGAQEKAKAAYGAPVTVTGPDGQSKMVRPDILADTLAGPGVAAPGGVSPQNPGMQLNNDPAAIYKAVGAQYSPPVPGNPPAMAPSPSGPPGIPVQSPAVGEGQKTDFTNAANYKNGLITQVQEGEKQVQIANLQDQLLNQFQSGAWTTNRADIANGLRTLGAGPDVIKAVAGGDPSAVQAFESMSAQRALLQAKSLVQNQRIAQAEFVGLQNDLADPNKMPEAIKTINQLTRDQYSDSAKELSSLSDWEKSGKPLTQFRESYSAQKASDLLKPQQTLTPRRVIHFNDLPK